MADTTKFVVEFQAQMANLRKAFQETERLAKRFEGKKVKNVKQDVKARQDDIKHLRNVSKMRDQAASKELAQTRKRQQLVTTGYRNEERLERQRQRQQTLGGRVSGAVFGQGNRQLFAGQGRTSRAQMATVGGGIASVAGSILGGLTNMITSSIQAGYQRFQQVQAGRAPLIGLGTSGRGTMRGMRGRMGSRLGFNQLESQELMPTMARATGVSAPREMEQGMRATGLGAGELGAFYKSIRAGGTGFTGAGAGKQSQGAQQFQKWMAAGMASGLEKERLPEFLEGIQSTLEEQLSIQAGDVGGVDYAKTLAMFGKSGQAGFQGARGAAVLGKLETGIKQPGGGEAGRAFMLQSMGFGKPGGTTGFYEAEKMREKGATGENIMSVMKESGAQYGGGKEGALMLREIFGVSLTQAETLQKIYQSDTSAEEKKKEVDKVMEESKSLEEQSLDQMKGIGGGLQRLAGMFDKSVAIGAAAAPYIQKLEDVQQKISMWVVEQMPLVIQWLKELYEGIKELVALVRRAMDWLFGAKEEDKRKELDEMRMVWEKKLAATGDTAAYKQTLRNQIQTSKSYEESAKDRATGSADSPWYRLDKGLQDTISDLGSLGGLRGKSAWEQRADAATTYQRALENRTGLEAQLASINAQERAGLTGVKVSDVNRQAGETSAIESLHSLKYGSTTPWEKTPEGMAAIQASPTNVMPYNPRGQAEAMKLEVKVKLENEEGPLRAPIDVGTAGGQQVPR